ncbi:type II toxin-antitoxin system RelE/ParE family toxin [Mesonia aquimarina]|uniref:type II toxin-antitoxin system RelE/ParE family toxin n=1 Tax=Mesonia aquimarina TaxID=1504967 RepID=UPI001F09F0FF|nr:type II toxin-antitoxin system RelE/ParE family toxin [Mesonia aquimarina]
MLFQKTVQKKLDKLFDYLIEKWSVDVKNEFISKLDDCIDIIKHQPEAFPESNKRKGLRRCVVTKQTTLYYRFNSKRINVVTIVDTRQKPKMLNKEI